MVPENRWNGLTERSTGKSDVWRSFIACHRVRQSRGSRLKSSGIRLDRSAKLRTGCMSSIHSASSSPRWLHPPGCWNPSNENVGGAWYTYFLKSEYRWWCCIIFKSCPFVPWARWSQLLNSSGLPTVAESAIIGQGDSRSSRSHTMPSSAWPMQWISSKMMRLSRGVQVLALDGANSMICSICGTVMSIWQVMGLLIRWSLVWMAQTDFVVDFSG